MRAWLAAFAILSNSVTAGAQPVPGATPIAEEAILGVPVPIEDTSGTAMRAFYESLRRTARGEGQTRIVAYGASHTASDIYTDVIRRALQQRFGDAGHGFVMPARPWRSYRHRGVEVESNLRAWRTLRITHTARVEDRYGLAGVAVEATRPNAFGAVTNTGTSASRFELWYLQQPGGGSADVYIDGRRAGRIRTRSPGATPVAGYAPFRVADGAHRFEVRPRGDGPVRLFGVTVERDTPGVIVDTLGINGSRAEYMLHWNDALHREHLARRAPALVVLAYGTNEAGDDEPIEEYERKLRRVVRRIREAVPQSSCLLVGPSDRPEALPDGLWQDRARTAEIIAVQRRVAADQGCGFFDVVAFQGGPMSMVSWAANDPPYGARDHVHFTRRGYERLGEVLLEALMARFDTRTASR